MKYWVEEATVYDVWCMHPELGKIHAGRYVRRDYAEEYMKNKFGYEPLEEETPPTTLDHFDSTAVGDHLKKENEN